jgi:hypothetical protein
MGVGLCSCCNPGVTSDANRGIMMENGKYGRERYDGLLRDFPVENPFPKKTTY